LGFQDINRIILVKFYCKKFGKYFPPYLLHYNPSKLSLIYASINETKTTGREFFLGVLIVFILLKVGNKNIDVPPSA